MKILPPRMPPFLKTGDTIGITCPAGYFCLEDVQPAMEALQLWGYKVKLGNTIDQQYYQYAGTDEERAADLQNMLDDEEVRLILFGRGGYGTIRIIDRINFNHFYEHPKWLCGYSDITVLHSFVHTQLHIPTLHCEMCIDLKYGTTDRSAATIRQAFGGGPLIYETEPHELNRFGDTQGILVGGNLSLLTEMVGSDSDLDTDGKLLFIEDVHEYIYKIDSMMWTLKRVGKLSFIKGLIVGGFTRLKEEDIPFGQTASELIYDKVKEYSYPVCFGFPAGHQYDNFALRLGLPHHFQVTKQGGRLRDFVDQQ